MTSWDELDAYLLQVVAKVGGTSYVLRDSRGHHLAPRPPAMDNTEAAFSRYLRRQNGENPPTDDAAAEQDAAGEFLQFVYLVERFNQYSAVLDAVLGVAFVKRGPGKRYVNREANLAFIAERFLSSYLLIIAFGDAGVVDAGGAVLALERARAVISDMLGDLPPDDGGDQAVSNAKRRA